MLLCFIYYVLIKKICPLKDRGALKRPSRKLHFNQEILNSNPVGTKTSTTFGFLIYL